MHLLPLNSATVIPWSSVIGDMFAKNPLDFPGELEREGVCEALRLAIIAELDAVSFYMQLARKVRDPLVKNVLIEVADEEKEHFGEFFHLLKKCDPRLAELMDKGAGEVREKES